MHERNDPHKELTPMTLKTDKTDTTEVESKAKPKRLAKSKRIHTRRVKAAAVKAGVART